MKVKVHSFPFTCYPLLAVGTNPVPVALLHWEEKECFVQNSDSTMLCIVLQYLTFATRKKLLRQKLQGAPPASLPACTLRVNFPLLESEESLALLYYRNSKKTPLQNTL